VPIGFPAFAQGSAVGAGLLGHVALGHLGSVDEAAALVRVIEVVHPDPAAADWYRRLLPAFAETGEAVEGLHAWRFDAAPPASPASSAPSDTVTGGGDPGHRKDW
jgi:gluconokinase